MMDNNRSVIEHGRNIIDSYIYAKKYIKYIISIKKTLLLCNSSIVYINYSIYFISTYATIILIIILLLILLILLGLILINRKKV